MKQRLEIVTAKLYSWIWLHSIKNIVQHMRSGGSLFILIINLSLTSPSSLVSLCQTGRMLSESCSLCSCSLTCLDLTLAVCGTMFNGLLSHGDKILDWAVMLLHVQLQVILAENPSVTSQSGYCVFPGCRHTVNPLTDSNTFDKSDHLITYFTTL